MDDDEKKFPPRRGPRPFGARGHGGAKDGKPASGANKPFTKKPFSKRPGEKAAEGERPQRDFKRVDRPREGRPDRPFREGRPSDKPYGKREGRAPRSGRSERAAFRDGEGNARTERPDRPQWRDRKPDERSFAKRPPRERPADGERTEKRFERPARDFGDAKKPQGGFRPRPRPSDAPPVEAGERIAKRLARAGIASRRDAEELIAAGRVKVNGKVLASPAFNVVADDVIHLDGTEIPPIERTRLFLFHKPAGVVTTNRDPEGRKTVFDVLPAELPRLMTVGRLDINTEGLLLLTNDGGLSRVLELPATAWLRRYRVRVHGKVEEQALADLRDGIAVDGVFYGAIEATLERTQGSNAWLTIGLREGKNREVKNILGALGLEVTRLIRVSYGPFQLGELPEGHVLEIKGRMLRDQLGERLIEESGANFEADIAKPFSNKPVRRTEARADEAERPKVSRDGDRRPIGEGGLIKARKRRENSRDDALGKLSTRPERPAFAGKPERSGRPERGPRKGEREQRPIEPPGQRKANVWMAPGARPLGRAKAEEPDAGADRKRKPAFDKPAGAKPFGKPSAGKPAFGKPRGERPTGREGAGYSPRKGPGKGPKKR